MYGLSMRIISIVLETKENGDEALRHLGVFSVCEDAKYTIYNTCQAKLSRGGGSTKSYTTINLVSHLVKHPDNNKQYSEQKSIQEAPPIKVTHKRKIEQQLSLEETQELSKLWDINDARSQRVHKRIGEMLAVDC